MVMMGIYAQTKREYENRIFNERQEQEERNRANRYERLVKLTNMSLSEEVRHNVLTIDSFMKEFDHDVLEVERDAKKNDVSTAKQYKTIFCNQELDDFYWKEDLFKRLVRSKQELYDGWLDSQAKKNE